MWTLTGWLITLFGLGLAIGLAHRYWQKNRYLPETNKGALPPEPLSKPMSTPLKAVEQERLEQWIYTQWEQRIRERLEQWIYTDPAQQLQQEWQQVQRVREQLERDRQAWEQQQKQQQEHWEREAQAASERSSDQVDLTYIKANWHHILGLASTTASAEEIKRAYHKRISEYHPDKVSKMGGKIQELAKVESQKINAAYEYIHTQGRA
jgi:hypothetical protein